MASTASGESWPARPGAGESIQAPPQRWIWLAALALVLAGLAVYSNSFGGPFIFDDGPTITKNPTIQQGWWQALHPPTGGQTVSGRPLVNLSLALNYQLGGFAVWGYHAVNLIIQLLAGLTLFGLVRRTLAGPVLRSQYGGAALPLAFLISLLWLVHPLQTESVTYIVQRAESLMGLFFLLTLYCFVRGAKSPRAWTWYALSVMACLLGMLTKEVMVSAPLMVLLYDRTFIGGTFANAWRQRRKLYAALAGTWLPLAWLVATVSWPGNAQEINTEKNTLGTPDLSMGMKCFDYGLKQCEAIVHYLRLTVWPHPLVLDYGANLVTNPLAVAPQMAVLALLLGGTIYALRRKPALGFLGAWFFVILAPTSSVVPLAGQTMAEHHMYLSLAALVVLAVLGLYAMLDGRAYAAGIVLAFALVGLTIARNRDYRTEVSIWADTLRERPDNPRAYKNLGQVLQDSDRLEEAVACYEASLRVNPGILGADTNIGNIYAHLGRFPEAIAHYQREIQRNPSQSDAYYNLGNAYYVTHQPELARDAYATAVSLQPDFALAHTNLASIYADSLGQVDQAIREYEAAVRADPNLPEAQTGLGNQYLKTNRAAEAIRHFSTAIQLKPDYGDAYLGLGNALFMTNRFSEAVTQYAVAERLMPNSAGTHYNFGLALLNLSRFTEATLEFDETLRLNASYPLALENLQKARQLAQTQQKDSLPPGGK